MKRPNWIDWLVYRFFRWWWNPILRMNTPLAAGLSNEIRNWLLYDEVTK
jgi:hypothetical protein